jgi:hypothetical protein
MDHDIMWQQFVKYRPMLEEAYEGWSKSKEQEELNRRKTLDGRPLSDEEIAANDAGQAGGRALPGHYVREGAHPQPVEPRTLEAGSEQELDRLREMAEEEGIDYEENWDAAKLKEELDMDDDEPVMEKVEEPPPPSQGQPGAPGTGATASGFGGQNNDPNAGASTGSGTPHANPASLGATASGVGGQNNTLSPEEQALIREEGLQVEAQPEMTDEQKAAAEQASDLPKASETSRVSMAEGKSSGQAQAGNGGRRSQANQQGQQNQGEQDKPTEGNTKRNVK